jgi:8-oxo-dGTP diphosphatase
MPDNTEKFHRPNKLPIPSRSKLKGKTMSDIKENILAEAVQTNVLLNLMLEELRNPERWRNYAEAALLTLGASKPKKDRLELPVIVSVLVTKNKKVLLGRRLTVLPGWYSTPGGHVEENETTVEAAIREVKEETGLEVSAFDLKLLIAKETFRNQPFPLPRYVVFYFHCTFCETNETVPLNTETDKCSGWEWIALNDVDALLCTEPGDVIALLKRKVLNISTGWRDCKVDPPPLDRRVLFTNNLEATDAFGQRSHLWIGYLIVADHKIYKHQHQDNQYMCYQELVYNVTHWMYLPD